MSPEILDWIESQTINGVSQTELARQLGVAQSTIHEWTTRDAATVDRFARAREKSAEAWLDKGLAVIEASFPKGIGGIDASAARAYAQECARRAAIRNPQYREKRDNTLSGPDGGPVGIKFDAITFTVVDPKRDATGD